MTETTKTRTVKEPSLSVKDGSEAAPAKRSKAAPAKGSKAAAQQIRLTPAVEAALAKAAADLPLSPSEIVDTAVREWLRTWHPGLL